MDKVEDLDQLDGLGRRFRYYRIDEFGSLLLLSLLLLLIYIDYDGANKGDAVRLFKG